MVLFDGKSYNKKREAKLDYVACVCQNRRECTLTREEWEETGEPGGTRMGDIGKGGLTFT